MRSISKEGSYLRLADFVSLNSRPRVIKKKTKKKVSGVAVALIVIEQRPYKIVNLLCSKPTVINKLTVLWGS